MPHAGHKVTSYNKSIQGPWESNMWNNTHKHGILEFMGMKEHPFTWEMYGAERPYVKVRQRNTYVKKSSRKTFNEI